LNCRYEKTVPQLLIRWSVQRNYIAIPKSTKPERILENAKVFDFTINDKDMRTLVGFIAPVDYPRECKCCMYLKDVWVLSTIAPLGIQASVVYFWSGASSVDKSGVLWWRKP